MVRVRQDADTKAYVQRRAAEEKSTREIKRCLKRCPVRQLFRELESCPSRPSGPVTIPGLLKALVMSNRWRPTAWRTRRRLAATHPMLLDTLEADARVAAANRQDRFEFRSRVDALLQVLRLMVVSDAFLAQSLYRIKARWQSLGIPGLPRLAHHAAIIVGQVDIGDSVVVHPGVYILHGQVVITGLTEIHRGTAIAPFVTIGVPTAGAEGPTIGARVTIGTGARILGPVRIGADARIGANAVVITDVPAGATAIGVPARALDGPPERRTPKSDE